jgi:hypothetical protein
MNLITIEDIKSAVLLMEQIVLERQKCKSKEADQVLSDLHLKIQKAVYLSLLYIKT